MRRLFDYYRQFEELSPEEVVARAARAPRRGAARARSSRARARPRPPAWREPPHAEAVNAATFALRRRSTPTPTRRPRGARARGRAPRPGPTRSRPATALASCCAPHARAAAMRRRGRCRVAGLGPAARLAQRAGGRGGPGSQGLDALAAAPSGRTRAPSCSAPPTTRRARPSRARSCAAVRARGRARVGAARRGARRLPRARRRRRPARRRAAEPARGSGRSPRRTRWRASASATCSRRPPSWPSGSRRSFGVNAPAQAAAAWALELGDPVVARRRAAAPASASGSPHALHGTSLSFPPAAAPSCGSAPRPTTARRSPGHLAARRILVARGDRWGDERHVRITLRDADGTDRLIAALRELG